jgi:Lipopolysaccharide-assembly
MIREIKYKRVVLLWTTLLFILTSCQYQLGYGELTHRYHTFSIPYVEGDQTGELTAEIIKKMTTSSGLNYVSCGGDLILEVKLIDLRDENIGFRYDRKKRGELKRVIIPSETRIKAVVEIKIVEASSQSVKRGPARLTACVDFDHTYYTTRHAVNVFSLGQLNDYDAAQDAVKQPLYKELAERIVDFVTNSW